jgi:two-component system response regulator PilR (NtrC family)
MQSKLLRSLQERTFRRVGGNEDISIDIRIVCASKRDLHREMVEGRFRDDLYFRLNVIQVFVPPLRDRREDIPALAGHFLAKFSEKHGKPMARIDGEAMRALLAYDYPGNVRELENLLERATIMETKNVMSIGSLPPNVTKFVTLAAAGAGQSQESFPEEGVFLDTEIDRLEKIHLLKALEKTGGNRTEAAKLLNISLRSIRYRLQKHGIE